MKTTFGKHITSLLKEHECVVLPGIGALLLKQKAAHISGGRIFPASKIIEFNKYITSNDHLLTSVLVNKEGLSYLDAKEKLNTIISDIKFNLNQKAYFDIDDLGRFKENDGDISFELSIQIDKLDKNNFGFNSLSVFEVQREIISDHKKVLKIDTNIPAQNIKPIQKRTIRKKSLIGLAATFLLMFAISSLMFTNTSFETLKVQNANVLNFLAPNNNNTHNKVGTLKRKKNTVLLESEISARNEFQQENNATLKTDKKKKKDSELSTELKAFNENTEEENLVIKETVEPVEDKKNVNYPPVLSMKSENAKGYYVVIGAFSNLVNANKAKYKCSIENTCSVFKTETGMYRVGIFASINKATALDLITEYKKNNSTYWLMENK